MAYLTPGEWIEIDYALRRRYQRAASAIERDCLYQINLAAWVFCEAFPR